MKHSDEIELMLGKLLSLKASGRIGLLVGLVVVLWVSGLAFLCLMLRN